MSCYKGLPDRLHDIATGFPRWSQRKRAGRKPFMTWSWKSHSSTSAIFSSLESSHLVHMKRGVSCTFWRIEVCEHISKLPEHLSKIGVAEPVDNPLLSTRSFCLSGNNERKTFLLCMPFRKGRGTRDHSANIRWIIEKAREFQKNIYFCLIDCQSLWLWGSQ